MRYSYVDTLRSLENLLRCAVHASAPFMFIPNPIWPTRSEVTHSQFIDGLIFLMHSQTMEVFFATNGFFTLMLLEKYDYKAFIINRLRRIVIPLAVGLLTLIPIIITISLSWQNHISLTKAASLVPQYFAEKPIPLAHLWSLWYLLLIYGVYLIGVSFLEKFNIDINQILSATNLKTILTFSIATASLMMMVYHRRFSSAPTDTWFESPMFVYFISYFSLGAWFFRHKEQQAHFTTPKYLWVVFILSLALNSTFQLADLQRFSFLKIIGPIAYVVQTHCMIIYIVKAMMSFNKYPQFFKRFAEASYWTYWIELPIILLCQWLWLDTIPAWLLLPASIFITFFIGYQSFHLGFRHSRLAKWLGFV
ncbi:MAG: acyltransferase family protein [Saprospiraceae bacterium]|nr:acyltransferase family protein [Saprospiraceae bacterium]